MGKPISTHRHEKLRRLLVKERKDAGLTQVQVAAKLRKHQSYVSKYELGERRLDVVEFLDIAKAIGFDRCEFLKTIDPYRKKKK